MAKLSSLVFVAVFGVSLISRAFAVDPSISGIKPAQVMPTEQTMSDVMKNMQEQGAQETKKEVYDETQNVKKETKEVKKRTVKEAQATKKAGIPKDIGTTKSISRKKKIK